MQIRHEQQARGTAMRANYKLQRLYLESPLAPGLTVALTDAQAHYLGNVLRFEDGREVLAFNGRDGEWRCNYRRSGRRAALLEPRSLERPQTRPGPVEVMFAPLKAGRLDYLVQKLVEMGAARITPVLTEHTQNRAVSMEKLQSWVIEAAEQCGVIALPVVAPPVTLAAALAELPADRQLIFCDEAAGTQNPLAILSALTPGPLALLIGPEGGFSDAERSQLRSRHGVTAIPLGPRILRADTAAVAALAVVQAAIGDWRD
jgi:16S rRNA (uracil1498-N3)-methyltransferase